MSGSNGTPPVDSLRYLFYIALFLGLLFVLGVLVRAA